MSIDASKVAFSDVSTDELLEQLGTNCGRATPGGDLPLEEYLKKLAVQSPSCSLLELEGKLIVPLSETKQG